MAENLTAPTRDYTNRLKWLMFCRVLFTSLLLGSTIVFQRQKSPSFLDGSLMVLYALIAGVFLLSFVYGVTLSRIRKLLSFAYAQIAVDTFVVTLVIFVTGSFSSIFTFLYLVVITYSSLFLFRKGSIIMAACCTIQYGLIVNLEFYGVINPYLMAGAQPAYLYPWSLVLYKVMIIMTACFAVAYLSGVLAEQVRRTKIELATMEGHVRRVEKMAYMGEMAANMAHEIKNPLASIAGSIQLLCEEISYNPDHDRLMRIVMRETRRLSELINNFLLFAKPATGRVEALELGWVLRETIGLFEKDRTCRGRITITRDIVSGIWVEMDPLHLRQVLWNLLLNAAEAIQGSGTISVRAFLSKPGVVAVQIVDSGSGIPPDIVNSIFDPFYTTKPKGTGLGLSIVHSILQSYGSRLDVNSKVENGTTVALELKQITRPD